MKAFLLAAPFLAASAVPASAQMNTKHYRVEAIEVVRSQPQMARGIAYDSPSRDGQPGRAWRVEYIGRLSGISRIGVGDRLALKGHSMTVKAIEVVECLTDLKEKVIGTTYCKKGSILRCMVVEHESELDLHSREPPMGPWVEVKGENCRVTR